MEKYLKRTPIETTQEIVEIAVDCVEEKRSAEQKGAQKETTK